MTTPKISLDSDIEEIVTDVLNSNDVAGTSGKGTPLKAEEKFTKNEADDPEPLSPELDCNLHPASVSL